MGAASQLTVGPFGESTYGDHLNGRARSLRCLRGVSRVGEQANVVWFETDNRYLS
jgi:hypothetical protein